MNHAHHFSGPLRVCQANPRYFRDESGASIYLTGSWLRTGVDLEVIHMRDECALHGSLGA